MKNYTYQERIEALRDVKMAHTREKWETLGELDFDDHAIILPPPEFRKVVRVMGGSGVLINDAIFNNYEPESNHPNGGFFGARACGKNFRKLLEVHPTYVDPMSSLAGGYMVNFMSYRDSAGWNPDYAYDHLKDDHKKYKRLYGA